QDRPRSARPRDADGTRGHGCPRVGRAPRADADRCRYDRAGGGARTDARGLGHMGFRPTSLFPSCIRHRRGRALGRLGPPRRPHRAHRGSTRSTPAEGQSMTTLVEPRRVSGGEHEHGHLEELRTDPIALMRRVREECGDVGVFQLADKKVVLLSGAEANEFFFRAADEDLDQQAAYPFMKPVFGEGVVFDASPERRKEMLHNSALRGEQMRGHAATIDREVQDMVAGWGDEGEIDLLEFFAELTIYTSSACLIGKKCRDQRDERFAQRYHDLEKGTDALAFVDPYAPIESFRRRDEARRGLVALVQEIMNGRIANPPKGKEDRDMLDVLVSIKDEDGKERFSADEITGIFISMMFAGHHTTSGTAAWALIELLRNPEYMQQVTAELDVLYSDGESVSFHALRQIPVLEAVLKRSEEHTSELQSRENLVCRLLLEKKK